MAARSDSDVRNELQALTECSICMSTFTDPRALPCVHVFCSGCLQGMVDTADASRYRHIHCPLCQRHTPIPQPPDEFPKAFFFNNLCEIMQATKSPGRQNCHPCSDDNEDVDADWICIDCADVICNHCKKYHLIENNSMSHICIEISCITPDKVIKILQKKATATCHNHNKELEYYCKDCNELLCVACKLTDEKHEQHKTQYTKDSTFVQVHRHKLEEFTAKGVNHLQLYKTSMDDIMVKEKKKDDEIDGCVQKIEDRFQEMYEVMKQHKDELIQQVGKVREQFHTGARLKHEKLTREHADLENMLKDTQNLKDKGTDIDVVRFSTKQLSELNAKINTKPDSNVADAVLEWKVGKSDSDIKELFGDINVEVKYTAQKLGEFSLNYLCTGLAITPDDQLIAAKFDTNEINVLSKEGSLIGTLDTSSPLQHAWDVVCYRGHTYVSDFQSGNVHVYDNERKYIETIETQMKDRCGMAIHDGIIYITSGHENCVYKIPLDDPQKRSAFLKHSDMVFPRYIATTHEITVITNQKNFGSNKIVAFNYNAAQEHLFMHGGEVGKGDYQLNNPYGVAIYRNQYVIASDYANQRLVVLTVAGLLCGYIPLEANPCALAVDSCGKLYVSTYKPNKIMILQLCFD